MPRRPNPANRRYLWRIFGCMTAYVITLSLALHTVGKGSITGPLAYVVGALPGIAVAGCFWAIGLLIVEQKDEFQRLLLVRQALVATGFALSISTIYGFLENVALVPHIDAFYIAILWFLGLAVGSLVNRLTVGADYGSGQ